MRNGKVLVLTSDTQLGARCAAALRPMFDTLIGDDGEQALLRARRTRLEGLVIDLDVPGTDMLNVVGALRGYGRTHDMPILAIASSQADDVVQLALEHGCDRVVARPVDCEALARAIELLINKRTSEAA